MRRNKQVEGGKAAKLSNGHAKTDSEQEDAVAKFLNSRAASKQAWLARETLAMQIRLQKREEEKKAALSAPRPDHSWEGPFFYRPRNDVDIEGEIDALTLSYVRNRGDVSLDGTTLRDFRARAVAEHLREDLRRLEYLLEAREPHAATAYAELAHHTTSELTKRLSRDIELIRPYAEQCLNWPVLLGRGGLFSDEHKSLIKDLGIGMRLKVQEAMLTRLRGKPKKMVICLAAQLVFRLEDWRTRDPGSIYWFKPQEPLTRSERDAHSLRPFGDNSWNDWFIKGWDILMEENADHPETNPKLRELGKHRQLHAFHVGQQKKSSRLTEEANIRDGIKKRVKEGFASLAKLLVVTKG